LPPYNNPRAVRFLQPLLIRLFYSIVNVHSSLSPHSLAVALYVGGFSHHDIATTLKFRKQRDSQTRPVGSDLSCLDDLFTLINPYSHLLYLSLIYKAF